MYIKLNNPEVITIYNFFGEYEEKTIDRYKIIWAYIYFHTNEIHLTIAKMNQDEQLTSFTYKITGEDFDILLQNGINLSTLYNFLMEKMNIDGEIVS